MRFVPASVDSSFMPIPNLASRLRSLRMMLRVVLSSIILMSIAPVFMHFMSSGYSVTTFLLPGHAGLLMGISGSIERLSNGDLWLSVLV